MQRVNKMKYKYIVNFPNSQTPVKTFRTIKAAREYSQKLVDSQVFDYQFFGAKIYLPLIKRVIL
jgi:hypothetical protein